MRDPCPYCGLRGISLSSVDRYTREIVRDIKDHDCPAWASKPALTSEPTDTTFIREAWNTPEALKAWHKYVERNR